MGNRALVRVLGAQALSSLGTSVSTVALAVMVFELTGSVLQMGGIMAASVLPLVVMSVVGGALVDRYDCRALMVWADVARACLILLMPFAADWAVGSVYVVAAAVGTLSAIFNPSQVKAIGELSEKNRLMRNNSFLSIARDGSELGGYLVGGIMVATLGYVTTFVFDAASYALSALLLIGLPRIPASGDGRVMRLVRESPAVLAHMWRTRKFRTNVLLGLIPMACILMSLPNAYALALQVYDRGAGGFAAMEITTSCGWIVGGLLASRFNYRGDRNTYVYWSMMLMATCILVVGLTRSFWVGVAFLALGAFANVGVVVGTMTLLQEVEPRPDKGRIIALRGGIGHLGFMFGLLFGGMLGAALGVMNLFLIAGAVALVSATVIFLPYWLSLRDHRDAVPEPEDPAFL